MFKNYSLVIVSVDFNMEIRFESPSDLIMKLSKFGFYGMDVANNFLHREAEKSEEWENENWIWVINSIDNKMGLTFKKLNKIDEKEERMKIESGYGSATMLRKSWSELTSKGELNVMEKKEIDETIRGYMKAVAKDVKERYKKSDYSLEEYMDKIVNSIENSFKTAKIDFIKIVQFFNVHYDTNNVWFGIRCFAYDIYENDLGDSL